MNYYAERLLHQCSNSIERKYSWTFGARRLNARNNHIIITTRK
jgi:hypothetical protein